MRILMLTTIAMMIFGFSTMTQAAKLCDKCHTRKPSAPCEDGYKQNGDLCCLAVKCNMQKAKRCDRCLEKAKENGDEPQACYDLCH